MPTDPTTPHVKRKARHPVWAAVCVAAVLASPLPVAAAGGSVEVQGAFVSVMVATQQWVLARLLQPLLLDGRYAVVQTRMAEPWGQTKWRLTTESTLVVDCANQRRRVVVVQQAVNAQADGETPPQWQLTGGALAQGGASMGGLALGSLPFQALPELKLAHDWPQPLQTPSEHRVGAEFACRAASLPQATPWPAGEVAALLRQTGGFDDVQVLKCRVSGRANPTGVDIDIRHSPLGQAVLLGEKWVVAGALHEDHLALADGDLEVRLTRATGVLRLVLRSEMQTVGTGVCRTVPLPGPRALGW